MGLNSEVPTPPNRTDFTSVTRSVSEENKGKRLMSSPSLTLRVSKVSAIVTRHVLVVHHENHHAAG